MKFSDGAWMMRDGVKAHYAAEAYEVRVRARDVEVLAPTRNIRHRGDTLQGPVVTVTIGSPLPNVISVKLEHFRGGDDAKPSFEIEASDEHPVVIAESAEFVTVTAGNLSARLQKNPYTLEFIGEGKTLTKSGGRGAGYIEVDGDGSYLHEQLGLGVGEYVYGLGERFTAFVKNGQSVEIWNRDGGTGSDQAYKNVPFYLTNRGYGVFVNHPGKVSFEVASEKVSRVQFSVPGEEIEYLVIYGPTPKEILRKYCQLTGLPALPPAWTFGLWLTTSFTTNYDEETVTSFIQGMADRDLPLHVFHFDCFWMKGFHWTDLEWDPEVFPDPTAMLARLKERGLKICVWINPYVAQASSMFEEGKRNGYFLKRPIGAVWQWDMWQPGMAIVDFTNPDAKAWFQAGLERLIDMGVDSLKTDFGERIPTDVVYFDGSDPERMHNYYAQVYNQACFEVLERKLGQGQAALFARSATAGGQKYPVHWGGDCWSEFEAMAESLRGGLSLCLSGFGFWSHDIGGFEGLPPAALYKRWIAFGLLSTHSRLHGSSSYRVPWLYDDEAVDVLRHFTKLKCRLMPYLFGSAVETHRSGVPMMRAMMLEFPDDPACLQLDRQYMLGDRLLVAPVFSNSDEAEFYLPAGDWYGYLDDRVWEGGKWYRESFDFYSLPLMVRGNTVLAKGAVDDRPDYNYSQGVVFEVFGIADGSDLVCEIPTVDGEIAGAFRVTRKGAELVCEVDGQISGWSVQVIDRNGRGAVVPSNGRTSFNLSLTN